MAHKSFVWTQLLIRFLIAGAMGVVIASLLDTGIHNALFIGLGAGLSAVLFGLIRRR